MSNPIKLTQLINVDGGHVNVELNTDAARCQATSSVLKFMDMYTYSIGLDFKEQPAPVLELKVTVPNHELPASFEHHDSEYEIVACIKDIQITPEKGLEVKASIGVWLSAWMPDLSDTFLEDSFHELNTATFVIEPHKFN